MEMINQISEIKAIYNNPVKPEHRIKITKIYEAYNALMVHYDENNLDLYESFKILLLDRGNNVLGVSHISDGGVSGTVCDPKRIFSIALASNASNIILSHNHPSGNLKPSQNDINMTKKLIEGGKILDISILDHIIISSHGYYSMNEECDVRF